MASSSIPTENYTTNGSDPQIMHHNQTLPFSPEELAECLPQPCLAEQVKEMQERLLVLETRNKELEGRLRAKKVRLRRAVVISEEEPSHRSGERTHGARTVD